MKAKFWTTTGVDIWRIKRREILEFTNLENGDVMVCDCVSEIVAKGLVPVTMPQIKTKVKITKDITEKSKRSKYKGVQISGKKFTAHCYDKTTKRKKYLGSFDSELVAAATVQTALGNKKEAMRLLNEYQEGNGSPSEDRPDPGQFPSEQ